MTDPITEAISSVIAEVMRRGVSVQPEGEGWVVRLASENEQVAQESVEAPEGSISRSW